MILSKNLLKEVGSQVPEKAVAEGFVESQPLL
jgi:hypothetical protein